MLAFGSPLGLAQSASLGVVSAIDRQLNADDPRTYIQTDASMNPGNSGGPLVDLNGNLLGISTMIVSQSGGSEGLGFAIPLEVVRHSYAGLRADGAAAGTTRHTTARPHRGSDRRPLPQSPHQGVLVEDIDPYGPAAPAGVLPGDVLLSLGETTIHTLRDLYRAEYAVTPGKAVDLAVMRGPDMRLLRITPGTGQKSQPSFSAGSVNDKDNLVLRLGLYGATLTPDLASTLGGLRGGPGVVIVALAGMSLGVENCWRPAM